MQPCSLRAVKLPEVKVGDLGKKNLIPPFHFTMLAKAGGQAKGNFFRYPTLHSAIFWSLDPQGCIVSHLKVLILEQLDLKKRLTAKLS